MDIIFIVLFIVITLLGRWVIKKYPNSWLAILWDDITDWIDFY